VASRLDLARAARVVARVRCAARPLAGGSARRARLRNTVGENRPFGGGRRGARRNERVDRVVGADDGRLVSLVVNRRRLSARVLGICQRGGAWFGGWSWGFGNVPRAEKTQGHRSVSCAPAPRRVSGVERR